MAEDKSLSPERARPVRPWPVSSLMSAVRFLRRGSRSPVSLVCRRLIISFHRETSRDWDSPAPCCGCGSTPAVSNSSFSSVLRSSRWGAGVISWSFFSRILVLRCSRSSWYWREAVFRPAFPVFCLRTLLRLALGLCITSSTAFVPRVPLQPADFVGAVSEPASGSGLTGLPVGAPPVTSARLANRLATARAVLFFLAPGADTDAGLGFVLLVVLGTGPRPVPWPILPPRPAVTLAYDSGGPLPDLRDAAATLTRSRDQPPSTALDVGVAGPCSRGLRSARALSMATLKGRYFLLRRMLACWRISTSGQPLKAAEWRPLQLTHDNSFESQLSCVWVLLPHLEQRLCRDRHCCLVCPSVWHLVHRRTSAAYACTQYGVEPSQTSSGNSVASRLILTAMEGSFFLLLSLVTPATRWPPDSRSLLTSCSSSPPMGMGPTTPSTTGRGILAPMETPPGSASKRASLVCWSSVEHPINHFPDGRGLMELTAPTALASSWLRCHGPSLSKRAVPPPRSWITTGWSTKAGALEPCCDGLLR